MISSRVSLILGPTSGELQQLSCRRMVAEGGGGRRVAGGLFWDWGRVLRARPWSSGYMACGVLATLCWASPVMGQFGQREAPAGGVFPDAESSAAPTPERTLAAFQYVEARVRGGEAGPAPALAGAAVTLRLKGQIVGRGWSLSAGTALEVATAGALEELSRRVPPEADALLEKIRQESLREVAISVEAAGKPVPMSLTTYDEADLVVSPGVQGVGVESVDGVWAVFPASMLYSGITPAAAFTACVTQLSGDPTLAVKGVKGHEAGEIAKEKRYKFVHFGVTHLAQASGQATPSFVYRGSRYISGAELDSAGLKAWAANLARALARRVSDGRVGAEYDIARDTESREEPGPEVNALCALALADFARSSGDGAAAKGAAELLGPLLGSTESLSKSRRALGQASTVLAGLCTLRLADAGLAIGLEADHPEARGALVSIIRGAMTDDQAWKVGTGDAERGLGAWALAMIEDEGARGALVATFRDAPGGKLMGAMPWAQYAASEQADVPSAPAMRDLRDVLLQAQLKPEQCDADEAGAVMFSRAGGVRPTWQSARATLLLAGMLADPRLTEPKEIIAQVSRLLASVRYLRQLSIDESMAWTTPNYAKAAWGVRPALWELRSSPEASALALLAGTRSLEALQAASKRLEPAGGVGAPGTR